MPEYEVRVESSGYAKIEAATLKEAKEKAREGRFESVRRGPWVAFVSSVVKKS